jgi:hypothetical protein
MPLPANAGRGFLFSIALFRRDVQHGIGEKIPNPKPQAPEKPQAPMDKSQLDQLQATPHLVRLVADSLPIYWDLKFGASLDVGA